jgi:hypothetical protein
MKPIPRRVQLWLVVAGYAGAILVAALLLFMRHMQYVNNPADAAASGGMYGCGDLILGIFIVGLFLIPTFLLVFVIRKSETAYTRYSQVLLGFSFTAPICSLGFIPNINGPAMLGEICTSRLAASPIVIVGMVVSRLLARYDRAKRLTLYALIVETGTFVLMITLFFFATGHSR